MVRNRIDRENRILDYLYMDEKNLNIILCSGSFPVGSSQNILNKNLQDLTAKNLQV